MSSGSVSQVEFVLQINGKSVATCHLKRHLAPNTVGKITRAIPLNGNAHQLGKSIIYFETGIESGIERKKSEFKKGDIAFFPGTGSICFCLNDIRSGNVMSPIGKIVNGIELLISIKPGDILSIDYAG